MEKKKNDFIEYLADVCGGNRSEIEFYVVKRISEKP